MGLDTSHDAWHGGCSLFNEWRREIAKIIGISLMEMYGFGGVVQWETLPPNPLHILLNHSDCDGEITWQDCKLVADGLSSILDNIDDEWVKSKAIRFMNGCILAYAKKENIDFH